MNNNRSHNHIEQSGFTLVEVLVALLVLSIGLLGLAALQTTSLQFNTDSYTRTQATLLAYDIIDRMRANTTAFNNGNYDVPDTTTAAAAKADTAACDTTTCSSSDLAKYDLGQWYQRMENYLPESTVTANLATIVRDAANKVTITIKWKERDIAKQQQWIVQL